MSNYQALLTSFEKSRVSDSKYYNMTQFIIASNVYIRTRSEESANFINRYLQLLSVTTDYSVFDPNTSIVCEFFVSLHELLTCLEPRSSLAWCCINVLSVACSNPSARKELIHTYQFIPPMSKLLGDHLSNDKKICLLTLMQELSCGLKICWLIPYLVHLISILIRWIEKEEENEQIKALSLGILVNLCYKNLPAIYTLSKCSVLKHFVRTCSILKGPTMEVNFCKLLIIIDYEDGFVPNKEFLKLTDVTFKTIKEVFIIGNPIELRHIVKFYLDIKKQNEKANASNHDIFDDCHIKVEKLIDVVDQNSMDASKEGYQHNAECISLILKFLNSFIELKLPNLIKIYPRFIQLALRWIQTDCVCSEAMSMLTKISLMTNLKDQEIFKSLLNAVPIFLSGLQSVEEDTILDIEQCKRLSSTVQLLRALVLMKTTRETVLSALNEPMIYGVFVPLIGINSSQIKDKDANNCSPEAILMYVNSLVLLNELARYHSSWVSTLTTLLEHRQIHEILAKALYSGNEDIRSLILCMAAFSMYPRNQVAVAMYELQPLIKFAPQSFSNFNIKKNPVMSTSMPVNLDEINYILKEAHAQKNVVNIPTSEVIELYEYKLSSVNNAELAAIVSEEAVSQQCTYLQQRMTQRSTEILRIRQLFIHTHQRCEELNKSKRSMEQNNRDLINRLEAEKGRCKVAQSQLGLKEEVMEEKEDQIKDLTKRLEERDNETASLEENNTKLKGAMYKMQENLKKQEKNADIKDEVIKKTNASIEHFKLQVVQLERQLKQAELELKSRTREFNQVKEELMENNQLIDKITKLTRRK